MSNAAKQLRKSRGEGHARNANQLEALIAALLRFGAAGDGTWDELSSAALQTVARGLARRVERTQLIGRRLRLLEDRTDVRACVDMTAPDGARGLSPAFDRLLQDTGLNASQRRYVAALYVSDPNLRAAIDEIIAFCR